MNVQPNNRARQCVSSLVPAELRLVLAFFLVAACSTTNGQPDRGAQTIRFAPRSLAKNLSPSEYYPDASRRAHETGEVILHFKIGTDGMAQAPYVVDETTKAVPRLIEEVQKMLRDTHYESGEHYRHAVTAGVELMSDRGKLQSTLGIDYYYRLCVPPRVVMDMGHPPHAIPLPPNVLPPNLLPPDWSPPKPAKHKHRPTKWKSSDSPPPNPPAPPN